jgi:hypothetical protein
MVILVNSVVLALYDYGDREVNTEHNQGLTVIGHVLTGLFGLEAIVKIIAVGFCSHSKSYVRNTWNILDFVMVILGYHFLSSSFIDSSTPSRIRAFRMD